MKVPTCENHPNRVELKFISERAEIAAEHFERSRREGHSVEEAQEIAMAALTLGLHFSPYNTIIEVLWNELEGLVDPAEAPQVALRLLDEYQSIFDEYDLSDEFATTTEYEQLYTQLTGVITLKFEQYGI